MNEVSGQQTDPTSRTSFRGEKENSFESAKKATLTCYVMCLPFEEGQECFVCHCVMKTFENVVALKLIAKEKHTVCMMVVFLSILIWIKEKLCVLCMRFEGEGKVYNSTVFSKQVWALNWFYFRVWALNLEISEGKHPIAARNVK